MLKRRFISEFGYDVEIEIDDSFETPQINITTDAGGVESKLMSLTPKDFERINYIIKQELSDDK